MPNFPVIGLTDAQLGEAAKKAGLALRVDELRTIANRLERDPSIVEVHAFDAQWSEHCSYKSSRHLLKTLPVSGPTVMQGPAEDAGILHLGEFNGERYGVVIAHESHNHPSQVVPFEGAATGVGGIVRDVLCMGAQVIAIADPLRLGRVEDGASHQRYVATGVVDGIAAYGNAIGVPNIAGDVYFDDHFNDNCLVNVVALGILKESEIIHSAAPPDSTGWDIVLVGKATDTSGFGGAAFSSVSLDSKDGDANKGAVQVPDPFLKSVIMRASYRVFAYLRENGITAGFKDLGAGGIMGCSAELCGSGGFGAIIDLDDVNTAVPNMPAPVIAIGETQERLCWVLPPDATAGVLQIYNEEFSLPQIAQGACAVVIGAVQKEQRYVLRSGGEIVMDVPIDFLIGSIRDDLAAAQTEPIPLPESKHSYMTSDAPVTDLLARVLAHRNLCSREPLYRQYDSSVRGTTVIARGENDAGVIAPIAGSTLGVALAVAGNPRYGKLDARLAAEHAVCEAVRMVAAVGARPLGLTDCLNFGNPQKPDQYGELVSAVDGLALAARELGTPFVSGNVSLYNEARSGQAIPPSPIIACVGALDDIADAQSGSFRTEEGVVYRIGLPTNAFGGSVLAGVLGVSGGPPPPVDYAMERLNAQALREAFATGEVRAARAIGNGGLLPTLARMCFQEPRNAPVGLLMENLGLDAFFSENGGFIVQVENERVLADLESKLSCVRKVGQLTLRSTLEIAGLDPIDLQRLNQAWSMPLAEVFG
ncbi:MAG: phosphoribosylformylglycinamidine synthase subunit PurL [Candidatus Eremiobacteraeota bacterium]|nr:phosphoribosylformylglycinamidine synthase subunit PurL [Candidatus Eremiobacteraeota bacterium]